MENQLATGVYTNDGWFSVNIIPFAIRSKFKDESDNPPYPYIAEPFTEPDNKDHDKIVKEIRRLVKTKYPVFKLENS